MRSPFASVPRFFSQFRAGTRSLKMTLAVYFIPISVVPAVFISYYATRVFEESTRDTLVRQASSERDAIVAEIENLESELLAGARLHATSRRLLDAVSTKNGATIRDVVSGFRASVRVRLYSPEGKFLANRPGDDQIAYLPADGLRRVKARGETLERFYLKDGGGFTTVARILLRDKARFYGVLEEERRFGQKELVDLKNRRGIDVVLLNRELTAMAGSFALSPEFLRGFSRLAFLPGGKDPLFISLGDARYAAFLFDLPTANSKNKQRWGSFAVFLSMTSADESVNKLKIAIVYITALLVLVTALLIFVFSNRVVRPIEVLVLAMKRAKSGRVEQIPAIDANYEIEYLVQSFNEMTRNVAAAKRTLELKLEELHRANAEIRDAQGALIQSAKMVSLGQIVAGVAHELNNPIGFIYSNMHHLLEYVGRIRGLVEAYRDLRESLPEEVRAKTRELEEQLEIDFILKDMEDLTRSCVEGATRVKDIVLGLRTFSRIEESKFRLADLHEGLRNTIRLLVTEFKERVTIHEEFGAIPEIECNLSQMNQVFMNLLSNAAQAIEGKGDIWIRTRRENEEVVVEIEDSGGGMAAGVVDKIFDPFFTTKRVGEGTGLGLSIAYGLVQKHHGTIEVSSRSGEGTCFTVRLPLRQPVAEVG